MTSTSAAVLTEPVLAGPVLAGPVLAGPVLAGPVLAESVLAESAPERGVDRVQELQARIRQMQATKLDERLLPTHPAIGDLLPGGGLKQGAAYSIERSAMLVMALLAAPSAAGAWCAVVGVPEFGVEAASRFGIDLERLVLVPDPGDQWLAVTAAVADIMGIVVTRPPARTTDASVARLAARLRQRGATMLVLGSWPQTEAMLSLSHDEWHGIGRGHGHLAARQVTVTVTSRVSARPRSARLWLPHADETIRRVSPGFGAVRAADRQGVLSPVAGPAETEVIPLREAAG